MKEFSTICAVKRLAFFPTCSGSSGSGSDNNIIKNNSMSIIMVIYYTTIQVHKLLLTFTVS